MKKILVVEDDKDVQKVFRIVLHSLGYQVDCLEDGERALQVKPRPDAIILDKHLAGMNGVDVCKTLKSMDETRHIPVIMISGSSGVEEAARLAGADDFMEKPFHMHDILRKMTSLLNSPGAPAGGNKPQTVPAE